MSDDSERTIIKPNPGGRRDVVSPQTPSAQAVAPMPPVTPAAPPSEDIWGGGRQAPEAPHVPQPHQYVPQSQPLPPQQRSVPVPGPAIDIGALSATTATGGLNPILEAAMPLLILLANVRIAKSVPQVAPMMGTVAQAIETFEADLRACNTQADQVRTAKYALCATADDIVQNLPSTDRLLWTQHSMLSRYFQQRDSGIGFFDELQKLRQNPEINHLLLGLMHACMSLGFEGKYRVSGGDVQHQQIRRDIYQAIRAREVRVGEELSPHWRGQNIAAAHVRRAVPLWAVGSGAAGLLLLGFLALRWLLGGMADVAEAKIAALHPITDVNIARVNFKPAEPPVMKETTQLQRLRERLASDISDKRLSVDYAGSNIVVRLLSDTLFERGSADIRADFAQAIARVGQALDPEQGTIRVVGHTDNTPLRSTVKFKDNQDLSEQRALAVAKLVEAVVAATKKIQVLGVAETQPLDPADSAEAKARNRRVEIFIPREDP
jgi:type VI secretion system protein ImpK